ncbi:MAG: Fe(3+) ABC transporter substrate-binding protein, partial [Pseudomonadota bacterium]
AQNPTAAKAFVDFLISAEGQQLASEMGYLPAHPDIAPPEGFPSLSEIELLDFDPAKALAEDEANKAKFVDIFGG